MTKEWKNLDMNSKEYFREWLKEGLVEEDEDETVRMLKRLRDQPYMTEVPYHHQIIFETYMDHIKSKEIREKIKFEEDEIDNLKRNFKSKVKSKVNSISQTPLFLTWTVNPKNGLSFDQLQKAVKRKLRCLVQTVPEYLVFNIEHVTTNFHMYMYLLSSRKIRSETLTWPQVGFVDKEIAKSDYEQIKTVYFTKENPYCDLSGLTEAEAMPKIDDYILDLF